jgi:hypothetical protein
MNSAEHLAVVRQQHRHAFGDQDRAQQQGGRAGNCRRLIGRPR